MQQLNPSEISDLIKQRIDQLEVASQATNEGTIVSVQTASSAFMALPRCSMGDDRIRGRRVWSCAQQSVTPWARSYWVITRQLAEGQTADVLAAFSRCRFQSCRDGWWTHSVTLSMVKAP